MSPPALYVEDLHKQYGQVTAVEGLHFTGEPGMVIGMVGPNGAGKTTTIRAICGIIQPARGRILVSGHDIEGDPIQAKKALAYVPDDPKLFDSLTVWEHIIFYARTYGVKHYAEKAEQLLRQFDMWEQREKLGQELSRGMRQKCAICCAYLYDPVLILFDEPQTGLDPRGIRTLNDSIRQRAEDGACVIVSSHLLALVEGMCSHLLVIHQGRQLYYGELEGVRSLAADLPDDASLEDVFFHATEGGGKARAVEQPPVS